MTRTSPIVLIVIGALAALGSWLIELVLVSSGRPAFSIPVTVAAALVALAAVVIAFAWPVRKVARGERGARVDPFRATRAVLLAKAGSHTGALAAGAAVGVLVFLLTRPVVTVGSLWLALAALAAAAVLTAASVIAEHWCRIREDRPDNPSSPAAEGA